MILVQRHPRQSVHALIKTVNSKGGCHKEDFQYQLVRLTISCQQLFCSHIQVYRSRIGQQEVSRGRRMEVQHRHYAESALLGLL